jgi:predicted adenylyl cyclase CyaB
MSGDKTQSNLEVELRYKIQDREKLEQGLRNLGFEKLQEKRVVDHWFIPPEVNSQQGQDEWFDSGRGVGKRIREIFLPDGQKTVSFGTKQVVNEHGHHALQETEKPCTSYEEARALPELAGLREFLVIDKTRATYTLTDFEIVIDDIANYGVGGELEYKGDRSPAEALQQIRELATKLGLLESDRSDKSLTVDAMHALAVYA